MRAAARRTRSGRRRFNRAARLSKLAGPGEILADEATRSFAADAARYEAWRGGPGIGETAPVWRATPGA